MRLQSFRIEQLRQFRQALVVDGLAPGLNLFVGPNESGKSSIVRALRAAFLERHRSSSVDDLQPWGDSAAAPAVTLAFDWADERWELSKRFLRQRRCDLRIGSRSFSGDEAEEQLAALLGFQVAARGASRPEHWGVPGLLWIEQGAGQEIAQPVQHAGKQLQAALGSSLGEMMSSEGDALIAAVESEYAELLTATGKPRASYQQAIAAHAALCEEQAALAERIEHYREQVDRLAGLQRLQAEEDGAQRWLAYRAEAAAVQRRLDEIAAWERSQAHEQQSLQECEASLLTSAELLQRFADQQAQAAQRQAALLAAQSGLEARAAQEAAMSTALVAARTAFEAARAQLQAARAAEQRASWQAELDTLAPELAEGAQRLQRAEGLQAELLSRRAELQRLTLDPAALGRLRALAGEATTLAARQQTVATRLQFSLADSEGLLLDDEPLAGEGERLLLSTAELRLASGGRLRILPGGEDVAALQREAQRLQDEEHSLLARLGQASLAAAEAQAEAARVLAEQLRQDEAVLQSLAPTGLAELQARQQARLAQAEALRTRLGSEDQGAGDGAALAAEALPGVAQAQQQLDAAEQALHAAEAAHGHWRSELLLARQAVSAAQTEWEALEALLQAPERRQQEDGARTRQAELRQQVTALQSALAQRAAQIAAANAEHLRQDVLRLQRSADAAENSARERRLELASLSALLNAQGAEGLEERAATLAAECARAQRREDELARRARALSLLLELLRSQRQALTRQLQAPLQQHLQRYVSLLFPGASLSVNEQLVPELLLRPQGGAGGGEEYSRFDALSFGAREQMALISRLAYADLLHEAGRPTLLILDDALVHSDGERLAAMKRVLFDAAERHQILLFSCHPQHWRDLGVAAREITQLRLQSRGE